MVSTLAAQTPIDGSVKVARVKGPVRCTAGNGVWQQVKVGDILKPGVIIQTGKEQGTYADLILLDPNEPESIPKPGVKLTTPTTAFSFDQPAVVQNTVRIWHNSALGIDKLVHMKTGAENMSETQLDLKAGRISGTVKKLTAASKYEVKFPNGVAGIRGTVYDLTAEGHLRVTEGVVVIAIVRPDGEVVTEEVGAWWQYNPETGKTPIPASGKPNLDAELSGLHHIGPSHFGHYTDDVTVYCDLSPHGRHGKGPPFRPPGPPPVTPPGPPPKDN